MLTPYRVLDLTDERGLLCGKILADLGADVIQIESPTGSPAPRVGPFYRDEIHPERSLYWWAYAANKRGVTPGTMQRWALGYDELVKIELDIIMLSMSTFGHGGPLSSQPGYGPVLSSAEEVPEVAVGPPAQGEST